MKVGDLVEHRCPPTTQIGKVFVVVEVHRGLHGPVEWIRICAESAWVTAKDYEVISPALSDEQLEKVIGGMSPQRFNNWRAEKLNESR
jgi:hypothetical protein